MKLNWNFPGGRGWGGGGGAKRKPSVGRVWISPGAAHCQFFLFKYKAVDQCLWCLGVVYLEKSVFPAPFTCCRGF